LYGLIHDHNCVFMPAELSPWVVRTVHLLVMRSWKVWILGTQMTKTEHLPVQIC